ncbi:hypothetical protein ACJIZ3_016656 [Penstemon smallii]|uniref:CWZF3/5/7 THD domain-containing protein n=1 Tax=Penstemon smallii TaxID=265156 RepID=A0ABD3STB3_9LAMI
MNLCGISEDETTNAVRTLYNQPAPAPAPSSESQHDRVNSSVLNLVGVASDDARYPGQETAENSGKKKPGSTNLDVPTHSSQKKNFQTTGKNIDVYQKVSLVNCSDIGTNLKIRSQRESDLDGPRASKRIKGEENNLTFSSGEAFSKTGRGSTSGLSHNASRNDRDTIDSGRNPEINVLETSGDGLIRSSKSDDKNSVRKRKEKEYRSSQIHTEPQLMEKMCADEHRKEKKARLSKSGPTNSSSSKVSGSHKNRTTVKEVEGSPVESVSSSPLRYSNSNSDNGGNDRKGMVKKESVSTINDHGTDQSQNQGSHLKKSMKGLSSCSKDMDPIGSDIDKEKLKTSEFSHDSLDHKHSYKEKSKGKRDKPDEKSGTPRKSDKFIFKKDAIGGTLSEGSKEQIQKESKSPEKKRHNFQKEHEDEKLHKKSDRVEIYGNGKSNSLPPLARVQTENGLKVSAVDAFNNGDSSKAPNVSNQPMGLRHPTPDSDKARDIEASSPVRRDSSSHAAHVWKEGKALKRLADRLKNSESADSIGLYFQATLKFLHGASLLESGSSEILHSVHTYSSTAKLLEFCAHEFEKSKDMAAAALAYKCMEVAYMRVVYSARASASRDQNELQTALQIVPPGESPSSSASDLDNLNHQANIDKAALAKALDSPQVSGGHIITSRNRSSLSRIIDFAQNVNHAMEASRKSRIAFTGATSLLGETSNHESLNSLKKALDFNFSDVEGLLRLVRIAMEAINR